MTTPLLHQVASGDPAAVKQLTRQYAGLIYALARRMCLSQAEVEDAVQDVFIALWQSAGRYNPAIAGEDTFIAMVARRRLIDRRRKSIRRAGEQATEDFSYMPDDDSGAPHTDRAALSEDARLASELLGTLRPEQQRVIRLAIGQGFSHEQIADQTGLPLGTVKTHVRRGLIALREAMLKRRKGTNSGPDANPNRRDAEDDSGDGDD